MSPLPSLRLTGSRTLPATDPTPFHTYTSSTRSSQGFCIIHCHFITCVLIYVHLPSSQLMASCTLTVSCPQPTPILFTPTEAACVHRKGCVL